MVSRVVWFLVQRMGYKFVVAEKCVQEQTHMRVYHNQNSLKIVYKKIVSFKFLNKRVSIFFPQIFSIKRGR